MILSKRVLKDLSTAHLTLPDPSVFELPEKVLQFGTGVLLRGLPDYFIDQANRQGVFNGRVAVVKSTAKGDVSSFEEQDSLYTICVRGVSAGKIQEKNIVSSAISRVIDATSQWAEVLKVGISPALKLIVSNTTEVGLVLLNESITLSPPTSYPAKLLAVLHARYLALGDEAGDLVVIATELIPNNGKVLHQILIELVSFNALEESFLSWLDKHVTFCNSLVDRIVPGRPDQSILTTIERELGYTDELLIMAEPYSLWAIEGDQKVAGILGLEDTDPGIIIQPDIEIFRELKVRLLNGSHTLTCGIAHLAGIDTVSNAMENDQIRTYIQQVMKAEIIPGIPYPVALEEAERFATAVLDRFANPFIKHQWISITFQYSMKLRIRILPVISEYYSTLNAVPEHIAFGFAAYIAFMIGGKQGGYTITDDQTAIFETIEHEDLVYEVLSNVELWGLDLTEFEGFKMAVERYFNYITTHGVIAGLALLH